MQPTDDSKFFKYLWRLNALLIAGAGFVCLMGGTLFVAASVWEVTGERHVTNVVNVGEQEDVKDIFVLGNPEVVAGTEITKTPLYRNQSFDRSFYSKSSGGNTVNYIFLDTRSGEGKWLVDTAKHLFVATLELSSKMREAGGDENPVRGFMYAVVESDTNSDGLITEKDTASIRASLPDGSGYKLLAEEIDELYALSQVADDKAMALYRQGRETISEVFDTSSMTRLFRNVVPKVDAE